MNPEKNKNQVIKIISEKLVHLGFRRYLRNSSWMFLSRIAGLAISFFVTTYVVKYLGPENYGQLSYALSITGIFSILATLGIDQVLYRELIEHPDKKNEYLGTALGLKLGAGILTMMLTTFVAWSSSGNTISFWLISIISISFIFTCWNIIGYEFQADVKSKYPAIISIYISFILSIAKIGVVFFNKGIIYLGLIYMSESLLYAIFYLFSRYKHYGPISKWKFNFNIARTIMKDSWPLLFSGAFAIIYTRIDQIMIKNLINTTSVGLYDAAARISEAWYFIPALIVSSFFPAIVNARKVSDASYFHRIKLLSLFLIGISIFVATPIAFFAKEIVFTVYGASFSDSIIILQIYIWAGLGTSLAYLTQSFLLAENNQKAVFIASFSAMLVNIILNIILIPKIGMVGAAWATFISYFFNSISLLFFKDTRLKVMKIFSA